METEDDVYNPIEPNFYNYIALNKLVDNIDDKLTNNIIIKINAYEIKNNSKCPYLKYLLYKDVLSHMLFFPELLMTNITDLDSKNVIVLSKIKLFNLLGIVLGIDIFSEFNEKICFKGFYINNKEIHIVFDLTECKLQIDDVYSNSKMWFSLLDEIVNHKNVCNFLIDASVTNFFTNNSEFIFLQDENADTYELPVIGYIGIPDVTWNKINFAYTFGTPTKDKHAIVGPYYYFTDYKNAIRESGWTEYNKILQQHLCVSVCNNFKKSKKCGIVRFALFLGKMKMIENLLNDENDNSEIKQERLNDTYLDKKMEILTMRISDHDGKWAEQYDSVFLGKIELDNGEYLKNSPIMVLKEYEQQIPLSYHFVDNSRLQEMYYEEDNYFIL